MHGNSGFPVCRVMFVYVEAGRDRRLEQSGLHRKFRPATPRQPAPMRLKGSFDTS
jgi:hypothetical protein